MIDRSYLPYQSAREFQDRGMAKWAGFFLSEHTTALHTKEIDRSQLTVLPLAEQIQLLEQAFQQQTTISITTLEGNQFGAIADKQHITDKRIHAIYINDIRTMHPNKILNR